MSQPILAQFGAGNIGRSLVGQLFANAGWKVVFLDVSSPVIDALNARGSYEITVKDDLLPGQPERITVENVSGVNLKTQPDLAVETVARAALAGTSVGAANIPSTCALIARAMKGREAPLSVMLCENLHNAARLARTALRDADSSIPGDKVGFIEAAISKMVPSTPREIAQKDPLAVWAEAYNTLYLDADAHIGPPPTVPGVAWRRNFQAYVDRKLLLHNFGHAAAAYHGSLRRAEYIWQCMSSSEVAEETRACMMETAQALAIRHAATFTFDENRAWADDLLRRFANRALGDPVARVGRDLRRKLAPEDRCIGALRLLEESGMEPRATSRAVAAAMLFNPASAEIEPMPEDLAIVKMAKNQGPEAVLTTISQLDPIKDARLIARVCEEYKAMSKRF